MASVEPRYRCSASGEGRGAHPILQVTNALARSITTRAPTVTRRRSAPI
ncbi:hypothetical protein AAAC11_00110 [Pseudomonas aeruginosa]